MVAPRRLLIDEALVERRGQRPLLGLLFADQVAEGGIGGLEHVVRDDCHEEDRRTGAGRVRVTPRRR